MASKKMHILRSLVGIVLVALVGTGCSSNQPVEPAAPSAEETPQVNDGGTSDEGTSDGVGSSEEGAPTSVPEPMLSDQEVAGIVDLVAGDQVQDSQGNLIAIYGVIQWPTSFAALSDVAHASFPFFADVDEVGDPGSALVVLDVGLCAAGIDFAGFGTAEFFVHEAPTEPLSSAAGVGSGVLERHPVVSPGFGFPSPAECSRGYVPVLWGSDMDPAIARYVLATRATAGSDIERYVYQWELDGASRDSVTVDDGTSPDDTSPDANNDDGLFGIGQTVTFNQGRLQDSTVVVDGWAELVGAESPIEGTRLVGVSLDFCPASLRMPEFGIGVDGWNIVSPLDDDVLGAAAALDPVGSCFDGWLEFAVPFGSVPTAFFASDGANADTGYAEWSLTDAALPAPLSS